MQKYTGVLYLVGAFSLAGSSVIAGRFVCELLGTFTITAMSLLFGLLGLLPLSGSRLYAAMYSLTMRIWAKLAFQALFGIFLFRMFLLQGLAMTSAAEAGILTGATPAITALLAWLVLKEPMAISRLLGIMSTVAGIFVIQGAFSNGAAFSEEHLIGNLLVLCAALCESLFNVLSRLAITQAAEQPTPNLNPIIQSTLVIGIAILLCVLPALSENPFTALVALRLSGWAALVWYGLFVTALAFIFWYEGITRCPASVAAAFSGMMPLTALILSIVLLGEQPGMEQWLGCLFVLLGMALAGFTPKDNLLPDSRG